MGYSGVIADCINALQTTIVAGASAMPPTIDVDPTQIVLMGPPATQYPNIVTLLPEGAPYERAKWSGAQNLKDSRVVFEIWVNCQVDATQVNATGYPYGGGPDDLPGLLPLASQVENAFENARAALITASTTEAGILDVQVLQTTYRRNNSVVSAVIHVEFWIRYFAGQR